MAHDQKISLVKRPIACAQIIMLAAQEMAKKVDVDPAAIAKHYRHPMDGYELACALHSESFLSVDRSTMELLDEMEDMVQRRINLTEKVWVEENKILPPVAIGSRVRCGSRSNRFGVIAKICEDSRHVACYEVKPEQAGMPESMRWIVKFENVIPATLIGIKA